jgi:hypothetical protein
MCSFVLFRRMHLNNIKYSNIVNPRKYTQIRIFGLRLYHLVTLVPGDPHDRVLLGDGLAHGLLPPAVGVVVGTRAALRSPLEPIL